MRGVSVVAVADPDPRARGLAEDMTGAPAYADPLLAVDHPGVEAVVVCASSEHHADLAVAALDAGRHLYLEKPLATAVADGRRVIAAAERAGTVAAVGLAYRFDPLYSRVRAELRRIGRLREVSTTLEEPVGGVPAWRRSRATGGGALLDLGVHHLDLLAWLAGETVAEVSRAELGSRRGVRDTATVEALLSGGGRLEARFGFGDQRSCGWVFAGDDGWLAFDRCARHLVVSRDYRQPPARPRADALRTRVRSLPLIGRERVFARALKAWAEAAAGGERAGELATLGDGLRALEAVESIEAVAAVPVGA